MGLNRTRTTVLSINQKDCFDYPSCAWPDPKHRKTFEFCENGAKAVTWEATPVVIASDFWSEHSVSELRGRSEYWLGMQGRLTEPVHMKSWAPANSSAASRATSRNRHWKSADACASGMSRWSSGPSTTAMDASTAT